MKSSKISSIGNKGILHINTKEILNQDFQWKVDLTYIKSNFRLGIISEVK